MILLGIIMIKASKYPSCLTIMKNYLNFHGNYNEIGMVV